MSQIRKSASFRSRIPVRRADPTPRRCYSPEPYRNQASSTYSNQCHTEHFTYESKQFNPLEQRNNKHKVKRQRHLASTMDQKHTKTTTSINDVSMANNASTRPKTIYSSSSYSSSDESQESEAPLQVLKFPQFATLYLCI